MKVVVTFLRMMPFPFFHPLFIRWYASPRTWMGKKPQVCFGSRFHGIRGLVWINAGTLILLKFFGASSIKTYILELCVEDAPQLEFLSILALLSRSGFAHHLSLRWNRERCWKLIRWNLTIRQRRWSSPSHLESRIWKNYYQSTWIYWLLYVFALHYDAFCLLTLTLKEFTKTELALKHLQFWNALYLSQNQCKMQN